MERVEGRLYSFLNSAMDRIEQSTAPPSPPHAPNGPPKPKKRTSCSLNGELDEQKRWSGRSGKWGKGLFSLPGFKLRTFRPVA